VNNPNLKIVGAGLLGTSLGLALARQGVSAWIEDQSKANLRLAVEYGAGSESGPEPDLVVVCVPPDMTADVISTQLARHPNAIVTDVASVKGKIAADVKALSGEASIRYVGSHPMAGREKGGPGAGRADLFFARPWVICASSDLQEQAVAIIRDLAVRVGALPIEQSAAEHDSAVALVSHLPQLVSSLLAARLTSGSEDQLVLAGQGLRDTARIAASDADLWVQIISQNSSAIAPLLSEIAEDLQKVTAAVKNLEAAGSLSRIHETLSAGNQGVSRIPGKHGGKSTKYQLITAMIEDAPGALAQLLTFIGEIGVNLEDINLEHSPGAQIGLVEMQVLPEVAAHLAEQLTENGWRLV
jgi:prephenate dehydrogenase